MLDDADKIFERVIANRILRHLSREGLDLFSGQFGFREARSTVDAILQAQFLSESITGDGEVALAISLDIANAFNSIPWGKVVGCSVTTISCLSILSSSYGTTSETGSWNTRRKRDFGSGETYWAAFCWGPL